MARYGFAYKVGTRPDSVSVVFPIQYLRALAAFMVVWHHSREQLINLKVYFPGVFGPSGVDLFFVISGFIMVVTTSRKHVSAPDFLLRRVIRVVPLYWILTLSVVVLAMVAPQLLKSTDISSSHVVQSLLFIPHLSPSHLGTTWPVLVPGWTLNYEMFFYVLFASILFLNSRYRFACLATLMGGLVLTGCVFGEFSSPVVATYTNPLLIEFLLGVALGRLWRAGNVIRSVWGAAAFLFIGFALLVWRDAPLAPLAQILGSGFVVAAALCPKLSGLRSRSLLILGNASYSIYLTHLFALGFLRWVWMRMDVPQTGFGNALIFMLSSLVFAAVVGWLVYRHVEQPITNWLNGIFFKTTSHALVKHRDSLGRLS
jgi:exopolysaccharide production protein ExoZ